MFNNLYISHDVIGRIPPMTVDLRLAFAPRATYTRLVRERTTGGGPALAGRLVLAGVVIGTSVAVLATRRVSLTLVATIALSWSFAVGVQLLAAAALILSARHRRVSTLRAFELCFLAHVPWSLWLLVPAAVLAVTGRAEPDTAILASAIVPTVWTVVLLRAFCQAVLETTGARVAWHQGLVWALALGYVAFAIGGWDRVFAEVGL
jgi:hypothetical protein